MIGPLKRIVLSFDSLKAVFLKSHNPYRKNK